ncbi:hypothetical protein SAMN05216174_104392 [Actinokineospora iranica]|uniref:Uncharacterized protein n=2 Tax=Actinokineospora iranica TaxID=1271860 RepID=A0A1G6PNN2_9PSEU|nr:hypothetical protein SAMN05216174_104392 [Actinokineospora iranica]
MVAGKQPKILRWFVLWVVLTALGLLWLPISLLVMGTSHVGGYGQIPVANTARFEVEQGEEFGLRTGVDTLIDCEVRPEAGEARSFSIMDHRHSRRGGYDGVVQPAWFNGAATVTCEQEAVVDLPKVFTRDSVLRNISYVLMSAGAACLLFGVFRLWQRGRRIKRASPATF